MGDLGKTTPDVAKESYEPWKRCPKAPKFRIYEMRRRPGVLCVECEHTECQNRIRWKKRR